MESTQDFLNALTIALVLAFATLIMFDFFAGLVDLWKQAGNYNSIAVQSLSQKPPTYRTNTLPYLKPVSEIVRVNTQQADYIGVNVANKVDTESIEILIQRLPQARIRTAGRRLGIADRVDGKYQKLGILRTQLKAKLASQPAEVAKVLRGIA